MKQHWNDLAARARTGDERAKNDLLAEVNPFLISTAARLTQCNATCCDVVQESLIALIIKLQDTKTPLPDCMGKWLSGVVRLKYLSEFRKQRRSREMRSLWCNSETGDEQRMDVEDEQSVLPEQAEATNEIVGKVRDCVRRLPDAEREVIEAVAFSNEARTKEEAANYLHVPFATFRYRWRNAILKLRACLGSRDPLSEGS